MNKPRFGGAFVIWVRSGCGFSKGRDNMAKKTEFDKEIEKWYKGVIKNFTRDSLKIVRSEAAKAGRRAARDMKKVFDSYLQTYYEYQPRRYKRQWYIDTSLLSIKAERNGDVLITFSNIGYHYKNSTTNPDMVFDSFMTSSRRSNAQVEARYHGDFGKHVVDFTTPDDLELFGSQISGSKYFDDMMKEMESTYQDAFDDYIWKSYYEQIRKLWR